jgi:threonine dehydrogenase-like Zn-dependent dehydrogenase
VRAAVITESATVKVVDRNDPSLATGDTLVAPIYVGLCGTDLELFDGSMPYFAQGYATLPLQPGHEIAAIVVAGGDGGLNPGTPVVVDPVVGCGQCAQCSDGRATHCADRFEVGVRRGMEGGAAERIAVPARNLHRVPSGVSLRAAVFTEPGVTVLNGIRRVADRGGRALVIGAGTLGGIATQLLVTRGLQVDVLARDTRRSELIRSWGATPILHVAEAAYDVVLEAAGSSAAVHCAIDAVAAGGAIALTGVQGEAVDGVNVDALVLKDATMFGVLNGPGLFDMMLHEIAEGNVRPDALIDSEFDLNSIAAAFARLASRDRIRPKVLLHVQDEGTYP